MKVFNIVDYGARYSDVPQTENIQKAIDDCFWQEVEGYWYPQASI